MTEAEARDLLRNCDWPSDDGLEAWMADQPWEVAPGGWMVTSELQGWRFALEPIPEALRLTAWPPNGPPAACVYGGVRIPTKAATYSNLIAATIPI